MYSFFIKRPITSWMLMLAFIISGFYSLKYIPIDRNPNIDFPVVSISTSYKGASPYVVDTNITRKIEDQISTISGIEVINSASFTGISRITVIFDLDKDIDVAAQEVRDAVNRAQRSFPVNVDPPIVRKVDTGMAPTMAILLHGYSDYGTMAYYADKVIKREFERVKGVGQVDLGGFKDYVMWIRIDPLKLAGFKLTPMDVVNALQKNNVEIPAGRIDSLNREYTIRVYGKGQKTEDINNIIIKNNIKIRDVGKAEFTFDEKRGLVRFKAFDSKEAEPGIALIIYRQSKENTVEVSKRVIEKMNELNKQLPPGLRLDINYDASTFIERSVNDALHEIVIGSILTGFVVFLFLGSLKMTFIPSMAIPVSILGAIAALFLFGQSLNTFTLLALAVAVGLVIDDAIVVMESIYRRNEEGLYGIEAAEKGTKMVIFALLASTASLIVIFVPVLFLKSVVGKFFFGFALTLIVAIAISYLISLSFTPMISARIVQVKEKNIFQRGYDRFEKFFDVALKWSLNHKAIVLTISILTVMIGYKLAGFVPKEFTPVVDEGRFLVRFETPPGSSFDFTDRKTREIEKIIEKNPYVLRYGVAFGEGIAGRPEVNGGIFFITLKDKSTGRPHQKEIMDMFRREFRKVQDVKAIVDIPSAVGPASGRSADVMYIIKGPDLNVLSQIANRLESKLRQTPEYTDVDTDLRINKPEIRVFIDRDKASALGITVEDIANTLNFLFGKFKIGTYEKGSESYDMIIKAEDEFLKSYENLSKIYVRGKDGNLIPLSALTKQELAPGYNVINRYNRQYSFTLYANVSNKSVGDAVSEVENLIKQNLPPGYTYEIGGQTKEFKRTFSYLGLALIVAIVAVYMVLASLFESLLHPFTVLLTLPLAISGVFGFILFTGTSLNVTSYFGIILLIGLVTRDSVLFIERIIQLKKDGLDTYNAIIQARKERLRPILMTTLTIVASLIPVALGITEGSEMRQPLAIAVIGGLITALPLSLFVIPIIYMVIDKIKFLKVRGV